MSKVPAEAQGVVSLRDVANMAGVSQAAVSNWRRRTSDFPQAVAGSTSRPLFAIGDVSAWLVQSGRATRDEGGVEFWAVLNKYREQYPIEALVDAALSALVRFHASDAETDLAFPTHDLGAVWHELEALARGTSGERVPGISEALIRNLARTQGRGGLEHGSVDSRTARLLASCVASTGIVYDPASGLATALLHVAEAHGDGVSLVGDEINPRIARLARQRAALGGPAVDIAIRDALAESRDVRADWVIVEPPFGMRWDTASAVTDSRYVFGTPPRSSSDLAWVQVAIASTADRGKAFVLLPMGPLFRGGAERDIRSRLIGSRCISAIIGLPSGFAPGTSTPLALWVLARADSTGSHDEVLLVDASEFPEPESAIATWLRYLDTRQATSSLPPHAWVDRAELIAQDSDLLPSRWVEAQSGLSADELLAEVIRARRDFGAAVAALQGLRLEARTAAVDPPRLLAVEELVRQGFLRIPTTTRIRVEYTGVEGEVGVVSVGDLEGVVAKPSRMVHADAVDDVERLTQPGDVLFGVRSGHLAAAVDERGGNAVASSVQCLRVTGGIFEPEYVASCLSGSWNKRFANDHSVRSVNPKDLRIPAADADVQREVVRLARVVNDARRAAQSVESAAVAALEGTLDVMRLGKAAIDGSDPTGKSTTQRALVDAVGASTSTSVDQERRSIPAADERQQ